MIFISLFSKLSNANTRAVKMDWSSQVNLAHHGLGWIEIFLQILIR